MNLDLTLSRLPRIGVSFHFARSRSKAPAIQMQKRLLPRHATLRLENRPLKLRVLSGCVWITRDGCPADWVLEAGADFDQRPGARVLVHALADAQVQIVDAACDA